ncbi:MAG: hypothetical protein LBJ00_15300 [Planctomycetaceae bacterium]|nr:hypothetical protein [Planctomycetaceae bacterium]
MLSIEKILSGKFQKPTSRQKQIISNSVDFQSIYSSCFKIPEAEQPLHVVALACPA